MNAVRVTYKIARRVAVSIVGGTILLLGLVMVVTPGPAVVMIPVGLAVLGLEFAWARAWLKRVRHSISSGNSKRRGARAEEHRQRHADN